MTHLGSPAKSTVNPAAIAVIDTVRASLRPVVEHAVDEIWAQVPAYSQSEDPELRLALTEHVDAIFRAVLGALATGRSANRSDFPISMTHARRRVSQGIDFSAFLRAFRVGQLVLWEYVVEAAQRDEEHSYDALSLVTDMLRVIEVGTSAAAESYLEAQQHQLAEADRMRRDLLEDLLARRDPPAGPMQALLRAAGLEASVDLIVTSVVPQQPLPMDVTLRDVVSALRGALTSGHSGLIVIRQEEVICVSPSKAARISTIVESVERALSHPKAACMQLAVGISTVHTGLVEIPEAYAEACVARDGLAARSGVLALPALSALDYLLLRHDDVARRLIPPKLSQFVLEDRANGGGLIATLLEYVACDLNAKVAAERLHLHVNSTYYRLDRIADRTGRDLRHIADIQELLIAIRLLTDIDTRS